MNPVAITRSTFLTNTEEARNSGSVPKGKAAFDAALCFVQTQHLFGTRSCGGHVGRHDPPGFAPSFGSQGSLQLARAFRRMLLAQRDGARIIASANLPKATLLLGFDRMLSALQKAGFSQATSFYAIKTLFDYTLGSTFEEQADPQPEDARLAAVQQINDAQPLPTLMKTLEALGKHDPGEEREHSFEAGLSIIITGLRATHTVSTLSSSP